MCRTAFIALVLAALSVTSANGLPVRPARSHKSAPAVAASHGSHPKTQHPAAQAVRHSAGRHVAPSRTPNARRPSARARPCSSSLSARIGPSRPLPPILRQWPGPSRCASPGLSCLRRCSDRTSLWSGKTKRLRLTAWSASWTKATWLTALPARCWCRCRPPRRSP